MNFVKIMPRAKSVTRVKNFTQGFTLDFTMDFIKDFAKNLTKDFSNFTKYF